MEPRVECRIVVLKNDGSDGVSFPLPLARNQLIFGRGDECDVRINRSTVSHEHAVLERQEGTNNWVLKHMSLSNPTYLNGATLDFPQQLKHGDTFMISKRKFRFLVGLEGGETPEPAPAPTTPGNRTSPRRPPVPVPDPLEEAKKVEKKVSATVRKPAKKREEVEEDDGNGFFPLTEPRQRPQARGRKRSSLGRSKRSSLGNSRSVAAEQFRAAAESGLKSDKKRRNSDKQEEEEGEEAINVEPMELEEEEAVVKKEASPARRTRSPATPRSAKQRSTRKEVQEGAKSAPASKRARPAAFVSPVASEAAKKQKPNTPASSASGKKKQQSPRKTPLASSSKKNTLQFTPVVVLGSPDVLERMSPSDLAVKPEFVSPVAKSVRKEKKEVSSVPPSPAPAKTPAAPAASPRKSPRVAAASSPPIEIKANENEQTRNMQQILSTVLSLQEYGRKFHHSFDAVPDDKEYLRRIKSKRAMSIGLIREKVRSYQYAEPADFLADWRLLWNNTQDWLPADSTPYKDGKVIYDTVRKAFAELFPEIPATPAPKSARKNSTPVAAASPRRSTPVAAAPASPRRSTPVAAAPASPRRSTPVAAAPASPRRSTPVAAAPASPRRSTPVAAAPASPRRSTPVAAAPASPRRSTPVAAKAATPVQAVAAVGSLEQVQVEIPDKKALSKFKKQALQEMCSKLSLAVTGTNADLVARLIKYKELAEETGNVKLASDLKRERDDGDDAKMSVKGSPAKIAKEENAESVKKVAESAKKVMGSVQKKAPQSSKKAAEEVESVQKKKKADVEPASVKKSAKKASPKKKQASPSPKKKQASPSPKKKQASPSPKKKQASPVAKAPESRPKVDLSSDFKGVKKDDLLKIVRDEKISGVDGKSTVKQIIAAIHAHHSARVVENPASDVMLTPRAKVVTPRVKVELKEEEIANNLTPEKVAIERLLSKIEKMSVTSLQAACKTAGLSSKGIKKDLIERLRSFYKC